MQIKTFLSALALALSFSATGAHAQAQTTPSAEAITEQVQLQQIRNATLKITYADTTFLIDPMLSKKGSYPGFEGTYRSQLRNPLVDQIGRAHVLTPVTNAHLVCRLLLEKTNRISIYTYKRLQHNN